jgi:ice-binding like protein
MSSPTDNPDPIEVAPKPWRRWLPLAIVAAIAGIIAIIAIVSAGDDDTNGDTANSVDESVAPSGSPATSDTSTGAVTTGALSTSVSDTGDPTSSSASTNLADSSPAATDSPASSVATDSPTSSVATDSPASSVATGSPTSSVATPTGTAASSPIDLGRAADFALLGNTAVASTGPTTVTGYIGVSNGPTPSLSSAANPAGLIIVSAQTARQAQLAVDDAIAELDGLAETELPAADLVTQIGPGTYSSATLGVTGTVTLDAGGDPNALFVFESAGTLTVAAASQIVLDGGARECNVFWRIASTATLGSGSTFVGTLIADDSITAASGADVAGRLIARNGAVTLDSDSIAIPTCA